MGGVWGGVVHKSPEQITGEKGEDAAGRRVRSHTALAHCSVCLSLPLTGSELCQGHCGFGVGSGLEAGSISAHETVTVSPDLTRAEGWNRTVCGEGRVRDHFHCDSKGRAWAWSAELAAGQEQVGEDNWLRGQTRSLLSEESPQCA